MTTPLSLSPRLPAFRRMWFWSIAAMMVSMALLAPTAQGFDYVQAIATSPSAQESTNAANIIPGMVTLSRAGGDTTQDLAVYFTVASVDGNYTSYSVTVSGPAGTSSGYTPTYANIYTYQTSTPTALATGTTLGPGAGYVVIPSGSDSVIVTITPIDNGLIQGIEQVNVTILQDTAAIDTLNPILEGGPATFPTLGYYQFNNNAVAQVAISEGDLTVTAQLPVPVAFKQAIPGYAFDPQASRRGVLEALYNFTTITNYNVSNTTGGAAVVSALFPGPPFVPQYKDKYIAAQFSGSAVVGGDYSLSYKITGRDPTTQQLGTGFGTYVTGQSGDGYNAVAYLIGDGGGGTGSGTWGSESVYSSTISILTPQSSAGGTTTTTTGGTTTTTTSQTTIMLGNMISFADFPQIQYLVTNISGTSLTISPPLEANLHNGVAITVANVPTVVGYTVNLPYGQGSGYPRGSASWIKVENGHNNFHYGDVIQFAGDTASYVVTEFIQNPYNPGSDDGAIHLRAFLNSNFAGLNVAITSQSVAITSEFPVALDTFNQTNQIIIPAESTDIQFGVTPINSGTPTGMRQVSMQLIGNGNFTLLNPSLATVNIADDASTANVVTQSNATSPGTGGIPSGNFLVTFTQPFPTNITVPYTIIQGPGTAAAIGPDYTIASLSPNTIGGTTGIGSAVLPAGSTTLSIPVYPSTSLVAGPETITLSLSQSLDFLLASGNTTSTNPTATMILQPSTAVVGVQASTPNGAPTIPFVQGSASSLNGLGEFIISRPLASSVPLLVNFTIGATPFNPPSGSTFAPTLTTDYLIQVLNGSTFQTLTATSGVFQATIPANGTQVIVYVRPVNDVSATSSFQVTAALSAGAGYTLQSSALSSAFVIVSVVPQIVTAAAITDTAIDAAPSTNFTITTSASATVAFSFPTVSGGAVYGTDYTALFPTTSNITVAPVTGQLGSFVATFTAAGTQPINIIGMADQSAVYPLVIELTVASGTSYQLQATTGASVLDTTVTPNVLDATVNLQQSTAVLVGENKPTPGQYNTGSSGGCGNGSGFATLLGLLLAAVSLTIVRRRQP